MGWRDRAKPVQGGSWRDRAKPAGGPISVEPGSHVPAGMPGIHGATGFAPDDATEAGPSDALKEEAGGEEAYLRGQIQSASSGFGDEVAGALDVVGSVNNRLRTAVGMSDTRERTPWQQQVAEDLRGLGPTPEEPLGETYVRGRDKDRAANEAARAAHPGKFLSGEVMGAVAVPIPGPGKASTLGRGAKAALNIGKGAGLGALAGAGTSHAEDTAGLAKDTGVGGLVGAGVGAAGELAGLLAKVFSGGASKAQAQALAKKAAELLKKENRAAGAAGGATSAGTHSDDILNKIISDPRSTPEQVAAAKQLIADPESTELVRGVYDNALKNHPRRLGNLKTAAAALEEARAANTPKAAQAAADEATSLGAVGSKVWDRAWRYGGRAAGALAGAAIGGWPGALVGGAIGGNPGTSIGNLVRDPGFRKVAFTALRHGARAPEWLASQTGLPIAVAAQLLHSLSRDEETDKPPTSGR